MYMLIAWLVTTPSVDLSNGVLRYYLLIHAPIASLQPLGGAGALRSDTDLLDMLTAQLLSSWLSFLIPGTSTLVSPTQVTCKGGAARLA